jgi:oryzin
MQLLYHLLVFAAAITPFFSHGAPVPIRSADVIPGRYIVQFVPDVDPASIAAHHNTVHHLARRDGIANVEHDYDLGDFKGYAGSFDAATIEQLNALDEVLLVEPDYVLHATALITRQFTTHAMLGALHYLPDVTCPGSNASDSGITEMPPLSS